MAKKTDKAQKAKLGTKADDVARPEGAKPTAAETAKQVADNVLGDMVGIDMSGNKKSAPTPELPEDERELEVEEDRKRLLLQGLGLLVVSIALLFIALGAWAAANITGNVVLLIVLIFDLTAVWFVCKAMGKRLNRYVSHVHVVDFGRRNVFVYLKSDPKKALVLTYKDIKNYKLIRQGSSLRLLLAGDWVTHPSGFQLVDINRPFMKGTLDELSGQIASVMKAHRVNERN